MGVGVVVLLLSASLPFVVRLHRPLLTNLFPLSLFPPPPKKRVREINHGFIWDCLVNMEGWQWHTTSYIGLSSLQGNWVYCPPGVTKENAQLGVNAYNDLAEVRGRQQKEISEGLLLAHLLILAYIRSVPFRVLLCAHKYQAWGGESS